MKIRPSITIEEELLETIKKMAEEQNRTLSNMVETLLLKALNEGE